MKGTTVFKKYTAKPVEIEAVLITREVLEEMRTASPDIMNILSYPEGKYVLIYTLEGCMQGNIGDYLVRGLEGEFYPIKASIFEKKYEPKT